ncbi:MAG: DVUA0089 family protein [Burkholderiales bacterium]
MKKSLLRSAAVLAGALALTVAPVAHAALNFSFNGTFNQDDNVRLINFTADGSSNVYLVSYGYAGGTQADGTTFSRGGFDTILSLFNSTGSLINSNDDGSSSCFSGAAGVAPGTVNGLADPNTGVVYDTCFSSVLAAGTYTVAVTEYASFANGPNLSNGFSKDGTGNFTAGNSACTQGSFCDVTGTPVFANRTNVWAYDVLNVAAAAGPGPGPGPGTVPEPGSLLLVGLALGVLAVARRKASGKAVG